MRTNTKTLVIIAMLSAVAYVTILFTRLPIMPQTPFIKYDPKDVVVVIGGFMYGPLAALAINVIASFVEMVTVGTSGPIGLVMTVLASAAFSTPAAVIYKRKHDLTGALIGLLAGSVAMIAVMLLWNYIITPIYTGWPRAAVVPLLIPAILPFNAIKCGLNASAAMFLYKPVVIALRQSGLLPKETNGQPAQGKMNLGVVLVSAFCVVSLVLVVMVLQGVI